MTTTTEAERAIKLIDEAEQSLQRAKAILQGAPAPEPQADLGARVMAEVLKRGGSVARQELYDIARSIGMDRRGLGGLFRQTGQTCLSELPGDRVALTSYGGERAQRYLRRTATTYAPAEPDLARAAEPSFAEDWDSPEDAIYDDA